MAQHQDRENKWQEIWRELSEAEESLDTEPAQGAAKERMVSHREFVETAAMLERFQVAGPTDQQTQAVLARLAQESRLSLDAGNLNREERGRFAARLASTHHEVQPIYSRMLRAILSQTTLFSRLFWLVSALVIIAGAVLMPLNIGGDLNSFLLTLSIVSGMSVFYALRSYGTPMAHLEATFPTNPAEIALGRLCIILMYDIVLAIGASIVLYGVGLTESLGLFIVSWLVPLCLCAVLAFVLIIRFGLWAGAVVSVTLWVAQLLMGRLLGPFYFMSGFGYEYWSMSRWIGAGLTVVLGVIGYLLIRNSGWVGTGGRSDGDPA